MAVKNTRRKLRRVNREYNPRAYRINTAYYDDDAGEDADSDDYGAPGRVHGFIGKIIHYAVFFALAAAAVLIVWGIQAGETQSVKCSHCGRYTTSNFTITAKGFKDHGTGYVATDVIVSAADAVFTGRKSRSAAILCEDCYGQIAEFFREDTE